jgi:hypothetical protein
VVSGKVSTRARILARGYKIGTRYMTTNIRDTVNEAFGYKFWDDQNRKIIRSRKTTFNEQVVYKNWSGTEPVGIEPESKKSEFVNLYELRESIVHDKVQEESWRWSLMNNFHSRTNVTKKNL